MKLLFILKFIVWVNFVFARFFFVLFFVSLKKILS